MALLPAMLLAQSNPNQSVDRAPQISAPASGGFSWVQRPYQTRAVSPLETQNSNRIFDLMQADALYLSLPDAIALALENNLDIQLQRYLLPIASTDVLRAQGGGLLRGLSLLINQPPPGIGGPNGPLLTNVTAGSTPSPLVNSNLTSLALITEQQNNLSMTGTIPASNGPAVPQFDPSIAGLLNWAHQTAAQVNPVIVGNTNWLVSNTTNGNVGFNQGYSPGTQAQRKFQ